MSHLKIADAIV